MLTQMFRLEMRWWKVKWREMARKPRTSSTCLRRPETCLTKVQEKSKLVKHNNFKNTQTEVFFRLRMWVIYNCVFTEAVHIKTT